MPANEIEIAAALLVTFVATVIQGTVGVGFAVLAVPALSLIDSDLAPVPQLIVAVPIALAMAWRERSAMDLSGVGWIIAGRVPGALLGVLLLAIATNRTLDLLVAGAVLLGVVIIAAGISIERNPATQFTAGVLSGTTGLVASIGGPPIALLYSKDRGSVVRASLAGVFMIGISISIITRVLAGEITWQDVRVGIVLLPAMALGLVLAPRLHRWAEGPMLRVLILTLSAMAALGLVVRALV